MKSKPTGPRVRTLSFSYMLTILAVLASAAHAQERRAAAGFDAGKALAANEPFEIILEGPSSPRTTVLLDKLDITSLFEPAGPGRLRYHGRGPALPAGERSIIVSAVDEAGAWTETGRFPIRLVSPRGFVSATFEPTADLTGKGQFGARHTPFDNAPQRSQFQDATTQLGFRTQLVRPSMTLRAEAQMAGVTFRQEALRFSSEGESAPKLDLSGYRVDLQRGSTVLSIGHLGLGAQRHLINGFQSRGVSLTVGQGRPVSLELAALNGTSIVGWSNALGLDEDRHRMWTATVGVETRPSRPGLLRVEAGVLRGSVLPFTGFNDGGVVAAETSRGGSLRVVSSAFGGRLRLDSGATRSRFGEAFDRQVEESLEVTPLESRTADARYADVSVDVLQNRSFAGKTASVTLNVRHEFVEPQFRSLGAPVQADLRTDSADVAFSVGSVSGTAGHRRTQDNLGGINEILTSRTRTDLLTLNVPLTTMISVSPATARWLPSLTLQAQSLHQSADVRSLDFFALEDIPDQLVRNVSIGADWQIGTWRLAGRYGRVLQNNRQPGRERSDFVTRTSALSADWAPMPRFSGGVELGVDRNRSDEQDKTDSVLRWGARTSWTIYKEVAVTGSVTNIRGFDDIDARDSENLDGAIELSSGFRLSRADQRKGRVFVRWVDRRGDVFDRSFGLRDVRRSSSFAAGLTVSMF